MTTVRFGLQLSTVRPRRVLLSVCITDNCWCLSTRRICCVDTRVLDSRKQLESRWDLWRDPGPQPWASPSLKIIPKDLPENPAPSPSLRLHLPTIPTAYPLDAHTPYCLPLCFASHPRSIVGPRYARSYVLYLQRQRSMRFVSFVFSSFAPLFVPPRSPVSRRSSERRRPWWWFLFFSLTLLFYCFPRSLLLFFHDAQAHFNGGRSRECAEYISRTLTTCYLQKKNLDSSSVSSSIAKFYENSKLV